MVKNDQTRGTPLAQKKQCRAKKIMRGKETKTTTEGEKEGKKERVYQYY